MDPMRPLSVVDVVLLTIFVTAVVVTNVVGVRLWFFAPPPGESFKRVQGRRMLIMMIATVVGISAGFILIHGRMEKLD